MRSGPGLQLGLPRLGLAAKGHAEAGEELVHPEGLSHVVVGALVEHLHLAASVPSADSTMMGTSLHWRIPAADLGAVQVGQAEVEHDDVG